MSKFTAEEVRRMAMIAKPQYEHIGQMLEAFAHKLEQLESSVTDSYWAIVAISDKEREGKSQEIIHNILKSRASVAVAGIMNTIYPPHLKQDGKDG